jgi:hypothetical protein
MMIALRQNIEHRREIRAHGLSRCGTKALWRTGLPSSFDAVKSLQRKFKKHPLLQCLGRNHEDFQHADIRTIHALERGAMLREQRRRKILSAIILG